MMNANDERRIAHLLARVVQAVESLPDDDGDPYTTTTESLLHFLATELPWLVDQRYRLIDENQDLKEKLTALQVRA